MGRFRDTVNGPLGKRLLKNPTLGFAAGRMKTLGGDGALSDPARSYISAAMWAARNSVAEVLEPLHNLSSQVYTFESTGSQVVCFSLILHIFSKLSYIENYNYYIPKYNIFLSKHRAENKKFLTH